MTGQQNGMHDREIHHGLEKKISLQELNCILMPTSWRKPAPVTRAQHAGTPRQMQDRRAAVSKARGESALHTEPRVSEEDLGADGLCPHLGRGQQAHCTSAELL